MKLYVSILLAVIPSLVFAQFTKSEDTGLITYTEVVEVEGTAQELYIKAKEWFVNAYRDSKSVIQVDSKDEYKIIGKGVLLIPFGGHGRKIWHTVTIQCKDDRYKYTIDNIIIDWVTDGRNTRLEDYKKGMGFGVQKFKSKIHLQTTKLIKSLSTGMRSQASQDNW